VLVGLLGALCQADRRPSLSSLSAAPVGMPAQVVAEDGARQFRLPLAS
jgi:hypothetical protein